MTIANLGLAVDSSQVTSATKALDNLTAAAKPAAQAADQLAASGAKSETVMRAIDAAAKRAGTSTAEMGARVDAATAAYSRAAASEKSLGSQHGALSTQSQALFHSLRSVTEQLIMGISPTQALAGQINHLTYAASGEGGLAGAFSGVASMAGRLVTSLVTPTTAVLALGAGALYVANNWNEAGLQIDRSLIGIGARTGETSQSLKKFASDNASATGLSVAQAREVAIEFTKTGNIAVSGLKGVGEAIHGYAILTGQDATKATQALTEAFSGDLVKGAEKVNETYGSMNASTLEYIKTLQLQGDRTGAVQAIMDSIKKDNLDAADSVSILSKAYTGFKNVLSNVFNNTFSPASPQDNLAVLKRQRDALSASLGPQGSESSSALAAIDQQIDQLQKKIDSFNAGHIEAQLNMVSAASYEVVQSIIPQIEQIDKLKEKLDILRASQNTPGAQAPSDSDAAAVAIQNQIAALQEALGQSERYNERVQEISSSWDMVGQSTALSLQAAQNQLPVIEAVGGAAKMSAQYAADYANAIDQGKTATEAAALAGSHLQASQAAITSAAQEQLAALKDQYAVISAMTPLEQARAQAAATYNGLIRQGVDQQTAGAISGQQFRNQEAKDNKEAQKQREKEQDQAEQIWEANQKTVKSSEQQLELIQAQGTDMEATVKASIAYDNAMANGATYTQAATIWANTLQAAMLSVRDAAYEAAQAAYTAAYGVSGMVAGGNTGSYKSTSGTFEPSIMPANGGSYGTDPNNPLFINYKYQGRGKNLDTGTGPAVFASTGGENPSINDVLARTASNAYTSGGIDASISAVMTRAQSLSGDANTSAVINQLGSLFDFKNSSTNDNGVKISNLQSEIALLNTLPDTIARDQKIADLTQSINQLRNSTDGLNATNQELLSPYYTQDPRTSHIGFRSQGMATGGYVDVPGAPSANDNMLAIIPVASGERISVDPMPSKRGIGGQTVVNITNHIIVGPGAKKDEVGRTVYQSTQNAVRQLKAVS